MKPFQMFARAALLALLTAAFANISSATAETTALCLADELPCSVANTIVHTHESTLTGNLAILLNSVGNVICDVLLLGEMSTALGNPVTVKGSFTYTNCSRGSPPESCTVTQQNGPTLIKVLKEAAETAKVTYPYEVRVKCGLFINCTYAAEGLEGTAKGPLTSSETNGSVSLVNQEMRKVGSCIGPTEIYLDITTTPLSAVYISR